MKKSFSALRAVLFASLAVAGGQATAADSPPPSINPHLNSKYLLQYRAVLVEMKHQISINQLDIKSGTPLDEAPAVLAGADGYTILKKKALDTTDGVPATHKDLDTHTRTVPEEIPGGLRGRQISETIGEVMNIAPEVVATADGDQISTNINFFHHIKAAAGGVATYQAGGQKKLGAGDYATYIWRNDGHQYALLLQLAAVEPIKND